MSARQNKKQRKGRNNPNNRERTVTTLTEDPNSSYLIPLSSEDPPGALMSSPFSIASSAGNAPSSSAYQPPSSYEAYGYTDFSSQPQAFTQQPQQQQQVTQVPSIPGKNDLERLENLKNIIKANQHASYRPIAQPAALAALYLGSQAQTEQCTNGSSQAIAASASGPSSPADLGRRPPRLQSKEWENLARGKPTTTNGGQPTNNVLFDPSPISAHSLTSSSSFSFSTQTNSPIQNYERRFNQGSNVPSSIDTSNLQGGATPSSAEPPSAGPRSVDVLMSDVQSDGSGPSSRFESGGGRPTSGNTDATRIHDETGYGGPRVPRNIDKSSFDNKDDLRTPRDGPWSMRNGPPAPDDRRRDPDRPPPSPRPTLNGNGGSSDTRPNLSDRPLNSRDPPPSREDRFYDRDRERERERYERDRRDWDRDRRSFYDRPRPLPDVIRRPPPEQRHYEPGYSDRVPRRYDGVKEEPVSDSRRLADLRRLPSPTADGRPPVRPEDDRLTLSARLPPSTSDSRAPLVDVSRPSHADSRALVPPQRAPSPDNRPVRGASFDDRHVKPATHPEERRAAPALPDVRVPPSSVRPADLPGASRPADVRDVPLTPIDASRPPIPLEERISRPSLQERISSAQPEHMSQPVPPAASRPELGRPLEERLSAIAVSADAREQRARVSDRAERPPPPPPSRPQPVDDRIASRPPALPVQMQDDRRIDDRSGRYTSGINPAVDRSTYPHPSARDDTLSVNKSLPSPRSGARDYRPPPRSISRERSATYRSDDRNYITDDRRTDAMDVDTPSRYNDSRSLTYSRPFSPPSAADLARDRARAAQYPPSPSRPPPPHDTHSYEDDRRYPPSRDWPPYQSSYSDRRREWSTADEEYYKSRQWDRNPPPPSVGSASDRDRYEREVPPPPVARNNGWETRDERERRDYPPPRAPSPSRPYDGPTRSLSSRLTDTYSSPAPGGTSGDRSYPPRDAHPTLNRVRQRSLSPVRRSGPVIDDNRPAAKRSREDGYGAGEYYPMSIAPSARDPSAPIRRQDNYTSLARAGSPPAPSSGGNAYFENRGPPLPSSNVATGSDRDYNSREYPVQPYDRQRSPPRGAAYSRGGYSRDARDDRRYPPPPPPPPSMIPPRRP